MKKEMSRFGVGPWFALLTAIYASFVFYLDFFQYPDLEFIAFAPNLNNWFGIIALVFGIPIFIEAAYRLHKEFHKGELITDHTYSMMRHPMYGSMIMLVVPGIVILMKSMLGLTIPVFMFVVYSLLIVKEERYLERKFGKKYLKYKKEVPAIFPSFHFGDLHGR